jgi:hypothetical protein
MAEHKPPASPHPREQTPVGGGAGPNDGEHEHGIPHDANETAEPMGTPNSDRHETETAPKRQST